jgi:hypothetical protein
MIGNRLHPLRGRSFTGRLGRIKGNDDGNNRDYADVLL